MVNRRGYPVGILGLAASAAIMVSAAQASIPDAIQATCRILDGEGGVGTGCVFSVQRGYVWVQTNAHVVENLPTVYCEFFREGRQSKPLAGRVYARVNNNEVDAAIVAIPEVAFAGMTPKPIPIAPQNYVAKQGDVIVSVGCPNAHWPSAFAGHILGYRGTDMIFEPSPDKGRSGSAIFDANGDKIIGLLFARNRERTYGVACSLPALYRYLADACEKPEIVLTQCGPNGCEVPDLFGRRLFQPRRPAQETPPPIGGSPWPGLQAPTPAAPPVDLSPILGQLNQIAQNLPNLQAPTPAAPLGPDPLASQALQLSQQTAQALAGVPQAIANAVKPVAEKVDKIEEATKPLQKFRDKLEADAEEGGLKGKVAQKILDKLEGGEGKDTLLHSNAARIIGVVLGIALVIGLVHWLRTGHGLVASAMLKASERNPENLALKERADRLAGIEEGLRNRLGGTIGGAIGGPAGAAIGTAVPAADALLHKLLDHMQAQNGKMVDLALNTPAPGQPVAVAPVVAGSIPVATPPR